MDAYTQLIEDSDRLRELIQRWRSHEDTAASMLPEASQAIRATAAAKEEILYPAIRAHAPERAALVDDAIRTNMMVEVFLAKAQEIGPGGPGFTDQIHHAAAAADELLLHERRDLFPAIRPEALPDAELARILDEMNTARAAYEADEAMAG
ncbi:hypothetical protein [Yinghuangia soli]|uniref:Uncharacterized protein n=1 Tax=Yinghuangia soli TaxID=2908204 RepID=A0AA41U111_9ACTN|nr:hypothetical protein [Yinghuangia soli]MCF2530338.1 hypothetical protein [Yinghuangia soli]